MSDTLDLMIADARALLNEPAGIGHATDFEIARWVNRGQEILARQMMMADANLFEQSDNSLGFIAGQEEYDLPGVMQDRIITKITRTDLADRRDVNYVRFQRRDRVQSEGAFYSSGSLEGMYYYIRGNKLGIKPTPTKTIPNNLLIHYLQLPCDLLYADVRDPELSRFRIPIVTTGSPPTLHAGRVSNQENYYTNARIRIISGPQRGKELTATAWNAKTYYVSFTPTLTILEMADITNAGFVILSPLPAEFRQALYYFAIMMVGVKKKNDELVALGKTFWDAVYHQVEETVAQRHIDENVHVEPPADFFMEE